jgi:putative hydrolases of HD superfamily
MSKKTNSEKRIANFLFEVGTMRKLLRSHRQNLLTDDLSDNIASHSYRVIMIGWFLAKSEKVDPYKVVMMCLLHDIEEVRTGDQNYIHKTYIKKFSHEVMEDQLGTLPYQDLKEIAIEYEKRTSRESIVAKDADLLDQILLLREYAWQGNTEAQIWLKGKSGPKSAPHHRLKTTTAKNLAKEILKTSPSDWWQGIWTPKNR